MIRNQQYTDLVQGIVARHLEIQASGAKCTFLKVTVGLDPMQKVAHMASFYTKLKSDLGRGYFVVLMTYATVHQEAGDTKVNALRRGCFQVMHHAKDTDTGRDEVLTNTERIGYELMAAIGAEFRGPEGRRAGRMLDWGSLLVEAVGPMIDSFYGTQFEFDFTEPATAALAHDPTKFSA